MKKVSVFALIATMTVPVFATDTTTNKSDDVTAVASDAVVASYGAEPGTTATTPSGQPIVVQVVMPESYVAQSKQDDITPKLSSETNVSDDALTDGSETVESNPQIKFPHGLQLGLGVSATGGLDGFVGYENKKFDSFWWKRFGVRVGYATTAPLKSPINSLLDSVVGDGIDIGDNLMVKDLDVKANHFGAMLDFYPFGDTWFLGGWRVSGGYFMGDFQANAKLTGEISDLPDSEFSFDLGDYTYKYTGNQMNGTARADWDWRGPYVGAGFDWAMGAGLKIYLDAGVVFTNNAAKLKLDVPTDNLQQFNPETNSWETVDIAALEQAQADALQDAQKELDKLKYYPMVKLGLMYRF